MTAPYKGWMSPNYAFDRRRGQIERSQQQRVQTWDQVGTATIALPATGGVGGIVTAEATVPVVFTKTCIEEPLFTFGSALATNQAATAGTFPTLSATVHRWDTANAGFAPLWSGATIGVVASGAPGLQMILHYHFSGMAMSGMPDAFNDLGTL